MNPGDQGLNQSSAYRVAPALRVSTDRLFEAFYGRHQVEWIRYAYAETGCRETAEQIIDGLTLHIATYWHDLQPAEKAAEHAWKVLKATIAHWLDEHGTDSAFVGTASFEQAVRRALARSSDWFAELEESIGLFSAISHLPERQRHSIILRYVVGYEDSRIASMLGVPEGTVRAHVSLAKKRIAEELGPHLVRAEA
ncbi:RNA polymerase sigma factor (sigma-70 family) [Catenulispora sp. GP43]|uniref:RNA polymerase sigma factor n=1 Tax=Catenulispora sp. GP43 TaxID=3156263 RepID=UPI003518640F